MHNLKLKTPATAEPISYEEAKAYLRLDHDHEQSVIETLIGAARQTIEAYTKRSLPLQSYTLTAQTWQELPESISVVRSGAHAQVIRHPANVLYGLALLRGPVVAIEEVRVNGQVVDASAYTVVDDKLVAAVGKTLPQPEGMNSIELDYQAGYEIMPADLAHAVQLLVTEWFEKRTPEGVLPVVVQQLCEQYRIVKL